MFFWFVRKNFYTLSIRILIYSFFAWILLFGGLNTLLSAFIKTVSSFSGSTKQSSVVSTKISDQKVTDIKSQQNAKKSDSLIQELPKLYIPVMISHNYVITSGGLHLSVGHQFNKGSYYHGKKVVFIDTFNRSYTLSDGTILRMQPIQE